MTFKLRKSLAVLMIVAMVMSTGLSAYATDWPTYQGNDIHNGILTDGVETSENPYVTRIDLPKNGSGNTGSTWAERQPLGGVDTVPVMETRNGNAYAYVLYDGYKADHDKGAGRLVKIDCTAATPQVVWEKQITHTSGLQLSSPYLDTGSRCIYVGASGYNQKAYNDGLALTGGAIMDWSVSPAGTTLEEGKVVVSGNQTVTLTQTNVNLTKGKTHRSATCVKINGNNVNMTITAKLNGTVVGSESLNSCNFIDGRFYFNEMFRQQHESVVNTGTNNILEFTYEISGNDSNTVEIEYCQLYEQNSSITKVTNIDEEPTTEWSCNIPDNAVIGTPIVKSGDYLYFGTWSGNAGTYYQYDIDNEELKEFNSGNGGFYRAGAVVKDNYVYFGGDKGYLYARPVGNNFDNTSEGTVIDLSTIGGVESGNVRSTISLVGGHLYFTSQGGYLWSFTPGDGTPTLDWKAQLAGTSTSTPTVVGDNIYVGYYSGFSAGGVQKVAKVGNHQVSNVATPGPVQSSILVYTKGGVDYLYFTTNSRTGAGYCFDGSNGAKVWQTPGETYALQGMAYSGGVLTFGNDNDSFYVIGERYVPPTPPETDVSDYSVVFSNIGNHNGKNQPVVPGLLTPTAEIKAKKVDGKPMIKLEDLKYLGASIYINENKWNVNINGQIITFTKGSNEFMSSISYDIIDPAGGTKNYIKTFSGRTRTPAQIINGEKYVELNSSVNQAGAFLVDYNKNSCTVYHYRVNGNSTAYADENTYLVGGPWLTDWNLKGDIQVTPNFKIKEMWDTSNATQNPNYYNQIKMSIKQFQVAENIRYHYNNNSAMNINSAFRSWYKNCNTGSSPWSRSYHTRGRAWDASNSNNIYNKVRLEFNNGGSDWEIGKWYYRTKVNGISGGHEIEKMPQGSHTWLHMQTKPEYNDPM